jgi:bacillithiol biosynthesis cysteine-adding enzyme BshC
VPRHSDAVGTPGAVRAAIDLTRLPWIRPLATTYAGDFAAVSTLFAGNPQDPAAWRDTIARLHRVPGDRPRLADVVTRQLVARGAPPDALAAAATLADPATVAVVTGQQAGLFGGPLYTLLKAVTAIQLARRVQQDHATPAVAVFWVEAEDHDWEEVGTASVLDANQEVRAVRLATLPGAGVQPVASLTLDEGVSGVLAELEAALAPTEFTGDLLAMLRRRYVAGANLSAACAGWLDDLLGRHGLVVFEAADPAAKPLVAELFVQELGDSSRTAALARRAGDTLARLGHQPQVEPAEDAVALFYLDARGRRAIRRRNGGFAIGETVHEAGALRAEARTHPERFSPNVLLRPIVQDALFPTVCYVAGPSELAYLAQLGEVYRAFGIEAPLVYARASATLVDAAAARFLDRQDLGLEVLHAQDDGALNRLLERQLPPEVERTLADTIREIAQRTRALRDAVVTLDPTLAGAVDTTAERMRDTLKTLQAKIIQASKRKDDTLRRQFQRTRALAFPGGQPQERTLSVAFFVNRYGPGLGARLIEELPLDTSRHYVIAL